MPGEPERLEPVDADLSAALGASEAASRQILTLYIPDRDRAGRRIVGHRKWVRDAGVLLVRIGGGVTRFPPVEGGWQAPSGDVLWERTVILYTYLRPPAFLDLLPELRKFLHRFGRIANQGEVVVDIGGWFFRIREFDPD